MDILIWKLCACYSKFAPRRDSRSSRVNLTDTLKLNESILTSPASCGGI